MRLCGAAAIASFQRGKIPQRCKIWCSFSRAAGGSIVARSCPACQCRRDCLYVCRLHTQAHSLFYAGEFSDFHYTSQQILAAVGRFLLPKGFTISLSITLRYFPTMKEEWNAVKDAMALRGIPVTAGGFLRHPMRTMEYVYVPMLVSASKISDEITQAAITRGIDHVQRRTCIENVRFHIWDGVVLACYIGMVLFAVLAAVRGWA